MHLPVPTAFAEDRVGSVWIGLYHGGLARYRNGRFELFGPKDGLHGSMNSLRIDSTGRLGERPAGTVPDLQRGAPQHRATFGGHTSGRGDGARQQLPFPPLAR